MAWPNGSRGGSLGAPASPRLLPRAAPVAFVEFYPNSSKALAPVAKILRDQFKTDVVWIAARPAVGKILKTVGISSIQLRDAAPQAFRRQPRLAEKARRQLRSGLDRMPAEFFRGTAPSPGRAYLLPQMQRRIVAMLDEAQFWCSAFSEAFRNLQPQCIASTTYNSIVGQAAAKVAHDNGISSVLVQHGLIPDGRQFVDFRHDHLLLWGESNRQTAIRNGVAADRVHVVGATIYDELAEHGGSCDRRPFPKLGEPLRIAFMPSRTGGLFVTHAAAERCLSCVVQSARAISNVDLAIKVHPNDRTGFVHGICGRPTQL